MRAVASRHEKRITGISGGLRGEAEFFRIAPIEEVFARHPLAGLWASSTQYAFRLMRNAINRRDENC